MRIQRYTGRLKASKYYTDRYIYSDYCDDLELIVFITDIDNILNEVYNTKCIWIRYSEQKELLKVLNFILNNYKLYKINNIYLHWNYYKNNYHYNLVWPREALISSLIYEISKNLWYLNSKAYNICLDFLNNYSCKLMNCDIKKERIGMELTKELCFNWNYSLSANWKIDEKYYF